MEEMAGTVPQLLGVALYWQGAHSQIWLDWQRVNFWRRDRVRMLSHRHLP